jgi:hypothetical protein
MVLSKKKNSTKNAKTNKKKSIPIDSDRRKKLIKQLEEEERYQAYLQRYFGKSYPDRELNTRSTKYLNYTWGLGAEHEMQLFHISRDSAKKGIAESNILFNSQESTCLLISRDKSKENAPACCRTLTEKCYHQHPETKKLLSKIPKLESKDIEFLRNVPWEYSGRQHKECGMILKRTPILMPEIITGNHKNRTIESICEELIFMENKFIELQMKNPFTKQKVNKYGELRPLPFGSIANVKVPQKYSSQLSEYKFEPKKYKDYIGSFHITITLPFRPKTSNKRFIENHQNFGNAIQWIEPLLVSAFFSGDPSNCISSKKVIRGSFRIMSTGWGNLAGSDLRNMNKTQRYRKGVGRYANIESKWRDYAKFSDTKKLDKCGIGWQIREAKKLSQPVGILSSNIRTFGFVENMKKCKENYCIKKSGCECPKVSGLDMKKPYGMEIRIFDHFNSKHLIELMRIMVYLAENSREHKCTKYVYYNTAWNKTVGQVMEEGWKAVISTSYIKEINKQLALEVELVPQKAFGLLKEVVKQLYEKNKDGLYSKIMLRDTYQEPPKIPQINRFSWQAQFNSKYGNKIYKFVRKTFPKNKEIRLIDFQREFFLYYDKKIWKNNILDVIYALEAKPHNLLTLKIDKGEIMTILVKDKK